MRNILFLFCLCTLTFRVSGQQSVKVMHYNLLQFGNPCQGVDLLNKYNWLGTILDHYGPDIFTVNEIKDNVLFANGIKSVSFDYTSTVSYAPFTNNAGSDIVNQLFYNNAKLVLLRTEIIANNLRDINVYQLYVKGSGLNPGTDSLILNCIVAHFKAQNDASSASQRAAAAQSVMNWIQSNAQDEYVLLLGDLNIYNPSESAFQTLVFHSNQQIRLMDVSGKSSGWSGSGNAVVHTQSTRSSSPDCGSGGGLDDRFDMILMSKKVMEDSSGLHYVSGTYAAFGNDGSSYNQELKCTGNTVVPSQVCIALKQMSDHLPVVLELVAEGVVSNQIERLESVVQIKVLGNPFGDHLNIELNFLSKEVSGEKYMVEIFDNMGRQICNEPFYSPEKYISIASSSWPHGVYLLKITAADGRWYSHQLIKSSSL